MKIRTSLPGRDLARGSLWGLLLLLAPLCVAAGNAPGRVALPDFTSLVEHYSAAVVNISTTNKRRKAPKLPPGLENIPKDNPFYEFYRRFFEGRPSEPDSQSLGSGFVVSEDGYLITNNHVVKDADKIIVRLRDRREFEAKLIGADEKVDVALLKIEASGLPTVQIGKSSGLKVGEWVLAIGSPFGFDYSVTAGIVSAIGRSLPSENYVPFIQTDVAINPGNSGGPLFNLEGEVVGVNAQIFTRTGQYNGLSFAIPIDVAWDVAEQLRTKGRVSRGWLGVMIQDVTPELAESFSLEKPAGALVAKVLPDSPAARAGLKVGDIVMRFGGHQVQRSSDLPPIVGQTRVDSRTPVDILRDGKPIRIDVVIAELPDTVESGRGPVSRVRSTSEARLGIRVRDLTAEERDAAEVAQGGVVVNDVEPGPAREAGIEPGDIILRFDQKLVGDAEQFQGLVADVPVGRAAAVLVQRDKNPLFLALKTRK